jgi:hypothetical protein
MNLRLYSLVAATVLATTLSGLAESVYVVRITDIRKADAWEVMTREDVAKLKKEVQEEARVFPAALAAVKKEWDADELLTKSAFPGGAFAPRKTTEQGPIEREQAEKKKQSLEERQADAAVKAAEEKDKLKRSNSANVKSEIDREALRQQNIDKALEKLNLKLKELLKREVPLNGL